MIQVLQSEPEYFNTLYVYVNMYNNIQLSFVYLCQFRWRHPYDINQQQYKQAEQKSLSPRQHATDAHIAAVHG